MGGRNVFRAGLGMAWVALFVFTSALAVADEPAQKGFSKPPSSTEARLRDELRVILLDMIDSGAFGDTPSDQIALALDVPAERTRDLGVLVDSSSGNAAQGGLQVLGTTPGSNAARMGLRSGDVLVSVNGRDLRQLGATDDGAARAAKVLRETIARLAEGEALHLEVLRDGRTVVLQGSLQSVTIPAIQVRIGGGEAGPAAPVAAEGCGRLTIFDNAPRQRGLHATTLISIDGERFPSSRQKSFRLSVGRHVLVVSEAIESRYLGFNERLRGINGPGRYKSLTIEVTADTTYSLAAHLIEEKRSEWRDGAYWEPVIWQESNETCR